MSTYETVAGLELVVESYELEGRRIAPSPEWERRTTTIHLRGGGEEGLGEDVVYEPAAHVAAQEAGPVLPLAGRWTLRSFAEHLSTLELFGEPPEQDASRLYRTWAYESAALDLALRQAGVPLHEVLGRRPQPLTFVNSLRLPEPATAEPVLRRLERYPTLRFKLDPTSDWTDALIAELAATGAVDTVDLKGQYVGTIVDQPADPELYRRVAEGLPDAWIEDPKLTEETDRVLEPHRARITWDAIIHGIADVEALPFAPRMVNVKPSRVGGLRALFDLYDFCAQRGIAMYGGGQTELGVGRGQIQLLAALFHPDTPNDVAPGAYNDRELPAGLPSSPMAPEPEPVGFRWSGIG